MRVLSVAQLLLATGAAAQGSRVVPVTTGPIPGNYIVIDTPVNSVLSYHYVANVSHWVDALLLCPAINPNYVSLARFYNDYEWNILAQAIDRGFELGGTYDRYPNATYFQGVWIGLSSPAPYPTGITPASPGPGPWTPVASWPDWQWVDGTNRYGATMDVMSYPNTKWGGTITAFNADHCGYWNAATGTGYLAGLTDPCATSWGPFPLVPNFAPGQSPSPGCCANARGQPDNSGGFQRCVLVAAGTNSRPVTGSTIFLDDQTCRANDQPIPTGNLQHFICESRVAFPPPPPPVVVVFDPHLFLPHGGRADFRGEDNTWYNMLTTQELSINVLFTNADFHLIKPEKQLVHGSRMQALGATIKTSAGKLLLVSYNSTWNALHKATVRDATGLKTRDYAKAPVVGYIVSTTDPLTPGHGANAMAYHRSKTIDNVHFSMERKQVAGMKAIALTIDNGKWEITAASLPFPNPKAHPKKALLNLKIDAKEGYDPDKDTVAPHGIIGQSYDGDGEGIDGAVDDYKVGEEVTTKAMAEGAIEGEHADYKMGGPFQTAYKYSRFGLNAARPRDTTKLRGKRVRRDKPANGYGASADVAPSVEDVAEAEAGDAGRGLQEKRGVLGWLAKLWASIFG